MTSNLTKLAAVGVLTLSATATAMASSVTQPGETAGLAEGSPLPPGFYFVDTTDWGVRDTADGKTALGVTIPVLAWSTPWKILGARFELAVAAPAVEAGTDAGASSTYNESMYNPFFGGFLAWNLGGGFSFSYGLGAYIGAEDTFADPSSFINNRFALSYTANGWDLTANAVLGTATDKSIATNPDYFNLDLTGTKTFGKWEVGAVGFYSTDLDSLPTPHYLEQSQFAVGGLVGYNWGPLTTQVYLTRDVYEQNYGGYDTRIWARVIVPLGNPFAPSSSGVMYHK